MLALLELESISQQGSMSHKRGFRSPLKCSLLTDNDNENPYFHVVFVFTQNLLNLKIGLGLFKNILIDSFGIKTLF